MAITYRTGLGRKLSIEEVDANFQYLEDNIAIVPNVTHFWKTGLTFTVRATLYPIAGIAYTSPETDVTLDAADGSNPRIDLLIANASGVTTKITGTAAATPAQPDYDEATEYPIAYVNVPAAATTPGGVTAVDIYKENVEWTTTETTSGARIDTASVNDPYAGTKSIEATSVLNGDTVRLTPSSAVNTSEITLLLFQLKLKAAISNPVRLKLQFYNASGAVSDVISIGGGLYGLDNNDTSTYQHVAIPNADFGFTATQITYLEIWQYKNFLGWFIDDVQYQEGLTPLAGDFVLTGGYAGTGQDLYLLTQTIDGGTP